MTTRAPHSSALNTVANLLCDDGSRMIAVGRYVHADAVTRCYWDTVFVAQGWQFICLHSQLDPAAVAPSGEEAVAYLRSAVKPKMLAPLFEMVHPGEVPPEEPRTTLANQLGLLEEAILSGGLSTLPGQDHIPALCRLMRGGDFDAWRLSSDIQN